MFSEVPALDFNLLDYGQDEKRDTLDLLFTSTMLVSPFTDAATDPMLVGDMPNAQTDTGLSLPLLLVGDMPNASQTSGGAGSEQLDQHFLPSQSLHIDTLTPLPATDYFSMDFGAMSAPLAPAHGPVRMGRRHSVSATRGAVTQATGISPHSVSGTPTTPTTSGFSFARRNTASALDSHSRVTTPLALVALSENVINDPAMAELTALFQHASELDASLTSLSAAAYAGLPMPIMRRRKSSVSTSALPSPVLPSTPTTTAEHLAELHRDILAVDFDDVTVIEMKKMLRRASLNVNGRKSELMDRLRDERDRIVRAREEAAMGPGVDDVGASGKLPMTASPMDGDAADARWGSFEESTSTAGPQM